MAGDDRDAKAAVASLVEEIGFGSVDAGSLAESGRLEPGSPVYNRSMTVRQAREIPGIA